MARQPNPGDWFGQATTSGDWGLVVSHDGQHFHETVKGHVFLHRTDSKPKMPAGMRYETVLCQANGILNVGDETRIYHGRWANTEQTKDYYADIGLATLPRDRWARWAFTRTPVKAPCGPHPSRSAPTAATSPSTPTACKE